MNGGLPRLPFVVIDMNQCRKEQVVSRLISNFELDGTGVYLPAIAYRELTKGKDSTISSSLRWLRLRPEAVSVARPTLHLKGFERAYKRPVPDLIVDRAHTKNLREVMRYLRADSHDFDPDSVADVRSHWKQVAEKEADPEIVRQIERVHRKELEQKRANSIRDSLNEDPPNRLPFYDYLGEVLESLPRLEAHLVEMGYGRVTARKVVKHPCFSLLHLIGLMALTLRWRIFGGVESARNTSLENDLIDAEYGTLAAMGRGLVSMDSGALETYRDIVEMANRLWH